MRRKELFEVPLGYWEEKSYMMVIPPNKEENLLNTALDRVLSVEEINVKENRYNEDKSCVYLKLEYENEEYEVEFFVGGISVPDYYLNTPVFSDIEKEKILNADEALTIFMKFKGDVKKCYHLQLKLAVYMIPNQIGVLDESAEKMLPAKWVTMSANSKILPSSKSLFSIQVVINEDKRIWLHTHGLCRCGITELEILDSDEENKKSHWDLINTYAMYLLDRKEIDDPRLKGAYIGRLINGIPVVATCVSWTKGIFEYKNLSLGGVQDRMEGHNSKTSIVFLYKNEKDEKTHNLRKVSIYDKLWGNNPLFFYSNEETKRMKDLARERFDYVRKCFEDKDNSILIKVGLYSEKEENFEHIWFELLEIDGDKFKAKLTQEPYYFEDMHTGYEAWYSINEMTDWIIYTPKFGINPDTAFLL